MIFDKPRTRLLLLGFLLIASGFALRQILTSCRGDYSSDEVTACTVLAVLLAVSGVVLIVRHFLTRRAHEMDFDEDYYEAKHPVESAFSGLTAHFREDLSEFYAEGLSRENPPVQADCTQLFRNILELRKQRLEHLGVRMTWRSAPRAYTEKPWRERTNFDGRYEVTGIDQEIEARRKFAAGGRTVLLRRDRELAHYTVINAHRIPGGSGQTSAASALGKASGETVICPNCGAATTRENLLDGCDFCGTRFTVEDLGPKISDFALRDDADLALAKFKDKRLDRGYIAFWIFFITCYIFFYLCLMVALMDEPGASGDPANPLLLTLGLVGVPAAFAYLIALVLMVFYLFVIFPVTEISGRRQYRTKKHVQELRNHEKEEAALTEKIREYDPLFSLSGFRSDIQNRLSTILYAETEAQVYAFTAGSPAGTGSTAGGNTAAADLQSSAPANLPNTAPADSPFTVPDLSGCLTRYQHVIDTDILEMNLQNFQRSAALQSIDLHVCLRLHELTPGSSRTSSREETVRMRVSRPASAQTQAVCAPYVLTCTHCGDSLSLTDGLICRSCGTKADLSRHGWIITGFQV